MPVTAIKNNYKVGRGSVYFSPFIAGTQTPAGESFLGDCNGLTATVKATQLDHYQSTGGVKILDESATIQSDSSGQLMTENISDPNLALFVFGTAETITTTAGAVAAQTIGPVIPGLRYQLGVTASDPVGARDLDAAVPYVVKDGATGLITYVLDTDYTQDFLFGGITVIAGGAITSGSSIKVGYSTKATTRARVVSGTTPIEGQLRFASANTVGLDKDMLIPWLKLTPNGNYELIGDKFQQLTFDLKILQKPGLSSIYYDGRGSAA